MYAIRSYYDVEGIVAARAAAGSSAADIDKLTELLDRARKCIDDGPSQRDAFIEIDKSIHMTLAQLTANPIYISVLHSVHDNIHRYYDAFLSLDEREFRITSYNVCYTKLLRYILIILIDSFHDKIILYIVTHFHGDFSFVFGYFIYLNSIS